MVLFSFYLTYVLLLTTGSITFIEALRNNNPRIRHVMNLETCISVIAAYFYSLFQKEKDWKEINQLRYFDWSITTPLMLLSLCLVLSMNSKTIIHLGTFVWILLMNYVMLFFGYLGETSQMNKVTSNSLGFVAFFAMYGTIFKQYVLPKYSLDNYVLFSLFVILWSLYGIVYFLSDIHKNIALNYLDLTAKCLVGIGLWIYYTKIIQN